MSNPTETLTVAQLDELLEKINKQEGLIEEAEAATSELNKELMSLEAQAVQYLKDLERDEYSSPFGKIKIEEKWRVNLPKEDADKLALFAHLRERGIFEKYATVNSNSLNALYLADWAAAKERGEGLEFNMPGVGAAQLFEKLRFKATKKKAE